VLPKSEGADVWYVVRTHPKQEERAESNLLAWKLETFLPRLKERRSNPCPSSQPYFIKPLFPQYLFARFDPECMLHKVRFTRGVHSIVTFGNGPTPVNDDIISMIKGRLGQDGFLELSDDLKPSDEVVITDGPFQNISGIFKRELKDCDRVMLLLETLSYQAHVIVEKRLVQKVASMSAQ
jgi:transcriptional antiterminator RfaH